MRDEGDRGSRTVARVPGMRGELIRVGDTTVRFLVEGSDSGGSAAVFEAGIRARGRMPAPHSHDGFEETVYGLEGIATWTIDGTAVDVAAGEAVCIPRGAVHHFDNHGDTDAKVLAIITPGVLGPDYFREVAAVFAESSGGPPDLARIGAVMRRHGLTPAAPPARGVELVAFGVRTITGITRSVCFSYSPNWGTFSTCVRKRRSRSSPAASLATAAIVSVPTSIVTFGLARRLWYQSGLVGAPPFEANTTYRSPSL